MKRHITISISDINYLEAERNGIIQKRMLSTIIDDFLTKYFQETNTPEETELINQKFLLEKELQENKVKLIKVSEKLAIINAQMQIKKEDQEKENKDNLTFIKIKSEVQRNSGYLDEVLND